MSVFKCKICGGSLEINKNETVATCEYCGTQQTLPNNLDNDKRANMYDRANHFRRNNEFDKAMGIYEQILNEDGTDAEAYWSLVLCRYGIEYVEDPTSHKRVPTVNRAQFTSIFDDEDYKSAIKNSDTLQKTLYEAEANIINEIQKGILAISQDEEPFDVFICYKETDNHGRRTPDSVLANDLYHQLEQEGFKVFFARITLEDKLGSAYEPYIFAALNSASVMVVLGTKPEFFNAVWVKNEWSRYLALIKNGAKKILIPAYRDMDPYDLPEEFSHLQAQDMNKLGFMQDLIRGIKKMTSTNDIESKKTANINIDSNSKKEIAFDDGYYIGEVIADQPNGYGVRVTKSGYRYEGLWKFGELNGQGKFYYRDKLRYEGEFVNGKFEGEGISYNIDDTVFKGVFKNNEPWSGNGKVFKYSNGHMNIFDGMFVDGVFKDGFADFVKSDGTAYKGIIKNGHMNGSGIFTSSSGSIYEGGFKDDRYEGYAVIHLANGGKIEGTFVNGKLNGKGKHTLSSGAIKEGNFVDDKMNGYGTYLFSNGDKYEGMFVNDLECGKGTYYYPDGTKWEGEFKDRQPWNGNGVMRNSDGTVYDGELVDGKFNGHGVLCSSTGDVIWRGLFFNDRTAKDLGICNHCGGELKGLIKKVCTKCGKTKDY